MTGPVIGIPLHLRADDPPYEYKLVAQQGLSYFAAIQQAGGVPIAIPATGDPDTLRAIFEMCDGILIGGGHDISPSLYGQRKRRDVKLTAETLEVDRAEKQLVDWCIAEDVPLLGVCRGMQMMNVACHGTLYQDLRVQGATTDNHRNNYKDLPHTMTVRKQSKLHDIVGVRRVRVNTVHHQGIQNLGPGLSVSGVGDDGIIEAVEVVGHRFGVGVQSHPETLTGRLKWSRDLFAAFVDEARAYSNEKGQPLRATGTDGPAL